MSNQLEQSFVMMNDSLGIDTVERQLNHHCQDTYRHEGRVYVLSHVTQWGDDNTIISEHTEALDATAWTTSELRLFLGY